ARRRARDAAASVRHLPARNGHPGRARGVEVRATQLPCLHRDPDRAAIWHPPRRRRRHRDGVSMARHRRLCLRGGLAFPLRSGDGLYRLCGRRVRARQPDRRHRPCHPRSTRCRPMTALRDIVAKLLRDPSAALGLLIILVLVAAAVFAPLLATHPEAVWDINPRHRLLPPSETYLFGTDRMGADIFSRILFGARITLSIAIVAVGAALLIGVPMGLVSGWCRN